jgi:hypothetical protein
MPIFEEIYLKKRRFRAAGISQPHTHAKRTQPRPARLATYMAASATNRLLVRRVLIAFRAS